MPINRLKASVLATLIVVLNAIRYYRNKLINAYLLTLNTLL